VNMQIRITVLLFLTLIATISLSKNNDNNNSQQSPQGPSLYEIKKHTLSSGGGITSAGNYSLFSSIGQIDAEHNATGGVYEFRGGFLRENTDLIFKNSFE